MIAVALDMDGVVFDTVESKATAFLAVFQDYSPDERLRIDRYNRANPGIPRVDKMRHIASDILGVDDLAVSRWLDRYAYILASNPEPPPLMAGVAELFADNAIDIYICSSAPDAEIRSHLAAYSLDVFAKGIFGFPVSKAEALAKLKLRYGENLCFVGDAAVDRQAALGAGVRFVLRSAEHIDATEGEDVIPDLRNHASWAFRFACDNPSLSRN